MQSARCTAQTVTSPALLAAQPDIIRSAQKDELYLHEFEESCHEVVRSTLGPIFALRFARETKLAAAALYYGLTSGAGRQTVGEEYCDLRQIAGSHGSPGPSKRLLLVILQSLAPYVSDGVIHRLERVIPGYEPEDYNADMPAWGGRQQRSDNAGSGNGQPAAASATWTNVVQGWWRAHLGASREGGQALRQHWPVIKSLLLWGARMHLAMFYLRGVYYQWAKRGAGIRYSTIVWPAERRASYQLLGLALSLQLLLTAATAARSRLARHPKQGAFSIRVGSDGAGQQQQNVLLLPEGTAPVAGASEDQHTGKAGDATVLDSASTQTVVFGTAARQCPMCLAPRVRATSTPCGHVFCWDCIATWCNEKPECPLCRTAVTGPQLVCVYHSQY